MESCGDLYPSPSHYSIWILANFSAQSPAGSNAQLLEVGIFPRSHAGQISGSLTPRVCFSEGWGRGKRERDR